MIERARIGLAWVVGLSVASSALAQDVGEPAPLPPKLAITRDERFQPSAAQLRWFHDELASEPHLAGTEGDLRTVDRLVKMFEAMELPVERHEFVAYLPKHIESVVQIVPGSGGALNIPLGEPPLAGDPSASEPAAAWNGYSGSGDVTAGVVYANYGTAEDFAALAAAGVDVKGKIALIRYGRLFRGIKAVNAERAGAAGVLLYSDPADSGFARGTPTTEGGGWMSDTCIERGSVLTLPYPGDPLTPGIEASPEAPRLDAAEVGFLRIPVQPIGWGGAREIMLRMRGPEAPAEWRGKMTAPYVLDGGADLRVRLMVRQERVLTRQFNVVAWLPGMDEAELKIVVGCHHDAWGHGASDATSGMIALLETARVLSEWARAGRPMRRTVVFGAWGAEELGIIGSTEWVESRREDLSDNAVAYFNLDMASMGPDFGSAAAPSLRAVIADVAREVPQPRAPKGTSVFDAWTARAPDPLDPERPRFGDLGGGSDHVGFWCHLAVASASLGGGGSPGTSYHTAYDTLAWYRRVVGEDYEPALMVTRMTLGAVRRLADDPLVPMDPTALGAEVARALAGITERGRALGVFGAGSGAIDATLEPLAARAAAISARGKAWRARAEQAVPGMEPERLRRLNHTVTQWERAWDHREGLPSMDASRPPRAWYRNLFAAPDEATGYGAWVLPGLRAAVERKDAALVTSEAARVDRALWKFELTMDAMEGQVGE